jgi:hypothetical protein
MKLFSVLVLLFLFLGISTASASLAPEEEWNRTFGGIADDYAYPVQQTTDGGYIIAGHTNSYGAGGYDAWLVKTNSDGYEQWNKTFGGPNPDYASAVQQTTDAGYMVAGNTNSYGAGDYDAWLVKTDSDGNEVWNKTFGGTHYERASPVQQTTDGGYIFPGITESYGAGGADFWLVKTDSDGNKQWDKTFGGISDDMPHSFQQTTDGGYILAGETRSYGAGSTDIWLVKTDSDGNKQWDKTFGGTSYDWSWSVQQTTDGGYILAGETRSYDVGNGDFWLVKTASNGNELWNRTYGVATDWERPYSVLQTTDGGYIVAGKTNYGAGLIGDFWLVKADSNGNEVWNKTFGGTDDDTGRIMQQTSDGGYIIAGHTNSYGAGGYDAWLIKTRSEESLDSGLLAYYPFNGNANDESGNGNDGTVYGATLTVDRFGIADSAYYFDGVDDYIDCGNDPLLNPGLGSYTMEAWIKDQHTVHAIYTRLVAN